MNNPEITKWIPLVFLIVAPFVLLFIYPYLAALAFGALGIFGPLVFVFTLFSESLKNPENDLPTVIYWHDDYDDD